MKISAKALREKRAPIAAAIRQLSDESGAVNEDGTYTEAWTNANNEYNALSRQIEIAERVEAVEAEQRARVGDAEIGREDYTAPRAGNDGAIITATDDHRALALSAWCRAQFGVDISEREREACRVLSFNPRVRELGLAMPSTDASARLRRQWNSCHSSQAMARVLENRQDYGAALTVGSGPAGGYLVPPTGMMRSLEVNMLAYGGVRQVAETITTASGERMRWPTADDTSNTGAQLGENTSIGSSTDPTFAAVEWDAYKFSSKPILVPYELIQDSAFDLPSLLGGMLGERLGRITNTKFTTGTGAATPKGIVTCSTAGVTAASATAIAADELFGLVHSIDPAYRSLGCRWMMHDSIMLALRKLKDGDGQYLWRSGLSEGQPDVLLGYPITNNQDMASSIAASAKTILFGLLSRYKIRTVGAMRMYRLEERYRDTDQDGFVAFIREDGNLLTAGTVPVKHLVQA